VGVGAIVLIEQVDCGSHSDHSPRPNSQIHAARLFAGESLACADLLGRPLVERTIELFTCANAAAITVLSVGGVSRKPLLRGSFDTVKFRVADEIRTGIAAVLKEYAENGITHALIIKSSSYTEANLIDLLDFHRETHASITRAADSEGPLDLWVVDCDARVLETISAPGTETAEFLATSNSYFVKEYVKRMFHPRDFRQLVDDAFHSRCQLRPSGQEIRPKVWAEDGVQVHRGARIVAPTFLGCGTVVRENTLITRFSNIERFSYIDYGTAIEDASILPNTYIGIWLDVRNAVVHGNKLLNLKRDVLIEMFDPILFRANLPEGNNTRQAMPAPI
jgi:NDP-sugar pyrophosphorylase family protein